MSRITATLPLELSGRLAHWFRALRPQQWIKNAIVIAPALFQFDMRAVTVEISAAVAILFCILSSGFYLLNDIADRELDRLHPRKRLRPIAAGHIGVAGAAAAALTLLCASVAIAWMISPLTGTILLLYGLLQTLYNLRLKQVPILDLFAIAAGFVLRAWAGAAACGVLLSPWFLLCTALLALFLGVEKRRGELMRLGCSTAPVSRPVLTQYTPGLLARMEQVTVTGAVLSYSLWSAGPSMNGARTAWMMLTIPFVLYAVLRYQMLVDRGTASAPDGTAEFERPEELLIHDRPMLRTTVGWAVTVVLVLQAFELNLLPR